MTREEIFNIASKMDEETRLLIDKEVAERLEILKEGDLSERELEEMEEYLYASLVLQEFLNGEYELLEEDRQALFDEMEEMYNKYSDLLVRAKIEEKVGKNGIVILSKITGLILAAMAAQMIFTGAKNYFV